MKELVVGNWIYESRVQIRGLMIPKFTSQQHITDIQLFNLKPLEWIITLKEKLEKRACVLVPGF